MKKLYSALVISALLLSIMPMVMAVSVGSGVSPNINTEDFPPQVWMCDGRVVLDDNTEPGRLCSTEAGRSNPDLCEYRDDVSSYKVTGLNLLERVNNYAFEGEKIIWDVLVMDKNGIEKVQDVFVTIGDSQGAGNDIEVNCVLDRIVKDKDQIPESCNARIDQKVLTNIPDNTAAFYKCIFTVETPESMYGQYWITVEAVDLDGLSGTMSENEYWFLNPVIALSIDGDMTFENVRPGTDSYSSTMLVGNDADDSSGVLLDMFISGTDFYDSSSSGAKCPLTNQLSLSNFRYFATNGAYSTLKDAGVSSGSRNRNTDAEGYTNIGYGIGFNNPNPFYDGYEIIQAYPGSVKNSGVKSPLVYYPGNLLAPGAEMSITFKLSLPEPCNGDFDTGSIYFWGEAI
ncbi:MAG: hypothetical protein QXW97_04440 [Candidatus Pacearchaeota archaeon]